MAATLKIDLFERFKKLYGLTSEPAPDAVDNRQPALGVKQDNLVETAEKALELLTRLKGYRLASGRMPVARDLAFRMRGLTDPVEILTALQNFERELTTLGGAPEPELAAAVAMVEGAFPGTRLVEVRRKEPQ